MKIKSLTKLVYQLLADGKYFFSKEFAASELNISDVALRLQILRLKKKKTIYSLWRGFFMIIPAEFAHIGSVPPLWLIDPLMKYLGHSYYISLLSSSSIYGVTQQQPQIFQVMCSAQIPTIELPRGSIQFHYSKYLSKALVESIKTPTSYALIATKEQTSLDLVKFYKSCGYFSNVATILSELSLELDLNILLKVLTSEKSPSHLQRLGYILEVLGFDQLANIAERALKTNWDNGNNIRQICYRKLRPDLVTKEPTKNSRWKLIINDHIEIDE